MALISTTSEFSLCLLSCFVVGHNTRYLWAYNSWILEKGSSLCPVPVSTEHVAIRTRVQDWTRVRILTGPVITDHWTEAPPLEKRQREKEGKRWIINYDWNLLWR